MRRLFHGTSATLADSIQRDGLRTLDGVIYLAHFRAGALEFAAIAATGAEDAGLDPRGLLVTVELDEHMIERDGILEALVCKPIRPQAIAALEFVEPIGRERFADRRRAQFAVLARHRRTYEQQPAALEVALEWGINNPPGRSPIDG
jgi:hypothetical protein